MVIKVKRTTYLPSALGGGRACAGPYPLDVPDAVGRYLLELDAAELVEPMDEPRRKVGRPAGVRRMDRMHAGAMTR